MANVKLIFTLDSCWLNLNNLRFKFKLNNIKTKQQFKWPLATLHKYRIESSQDLDNVTLKRRLQVPHSCLVCCAIPCQVYSVSKK